MSLTVAGDQTPSIPLSDVVGKTGGVLPAQNDGTGANCGFVRGMTVTVIDVGAAQFPAVGAKLYVRVPTVDTSRVAGDQVPCIPSSDVVGSGGIEVV